MIRRELNQLNISTQEAGLMEPGVAKSHGQHVTRVRNVGTWERDVPTYRRTQTFTMGRSYVFKDRSPYL